VPPDARPAEQSLPAGSEVRAPLTMGPLAAPYPARGRAHGWALHPRTWAALGRHQIASIAATAVDYAIMLVLVEFAGLLPALATAAGATCGAVVNFSLGRHWTFGPAEGEARPQALRYAFVSAVSMLLQSAGEHALAGSASSHYVVARIGLSIVVSLAWNFPMQRGFVFRKAR
jgi:putative flippase GtrA